MNETEAFDIFDGELKLDPVERLRAEKCHDEITMLLKGAGLIVDAFLQGSFRRKTMIKPLRDIDKVVILAEQLRGLAPDQVMDRLETVLAKKYPHVTFERTRHSLKLDFGEDTFCFDVVPAWESDTNDDDVMIADREPRDPAMPWKRSNTRRLIHLVEQRNKATKGTLVHAVRMIKHLVVEHMDAVVPGLHVEAFAYPAIAKSMTYAKACVVILESAVSLLASGYTDPTGVDKLSTRLTESERVKALAAFRTAATHAREAHDLALAGDDANAVRGWHGILGDPFPAGGKQDLKSALLASVGGSITSSGNVSPTTAARQVAPPTRSWRQI